MIVEQVYVFLWTILTGAIMGLIFDFFRLLRRNGNTKDIWVYIQDVLFWIIIAITIIVSTFLINDGELRAYMLLGYILGVLFYMLLFSKPILTAFNFIFDVIENVSKKIWKSLSKLFEKMVDRKKTVKNLEN